MSKSKCHKKVEIRNNKYFNGSRFQEDLLNQNWEKIDNEQCVNRIWAVWKTLFLDVLNKHAPIRTKRIRNRSSVAWLTKAIKQKICERNRLKLHALRSNSEQDWKVYKMSRNRVTNALSEEKATYRNHLKRVKHNPKLALKTINQILNRKQQDSVIKNIQSSNGLISTPEEIALFYDYFTDIGPKIAETINGERNFENYEQKAKSNFKFRTVDTPEVIKLLFSLCTSKATGIDKISAKIIKFAAPIISNSLTKISKMAIDTETFPSEWKIARVTPSHKKGPRNLLYNYRAISILPVRFFRKSYMRNCTNI